MQNVRHTWDAVWVKAEEIIREGILVSPSMSSDHYALTLQVGSRPHDRMQGDLDYCILKSKR